MHVEQLDEDTVAFFTRPTRGGVQKSTMRNLLVERPTIRLSRVVSSRNRMEMNLSSSSSDESQ